MDDEEGRALHLSEALVLAAGLVVAVLAWASLLLANLGAHSLPAVAGLTLLTLAVVAAVVLKATARPSLRVDRTGLLLIAGVGLLAAVLSVPGFPYAIADKDPGVYVLHGQAIAREGSTTIDDEVVARDLPVRYMTPGARFAGIWVDPDDPTTITPQFFHLYPSLLATADDVAGTAGLFNVNPVLAVLAAMAVALAVKRAFGTPAGAIAGVLLATGMLQVWQAKYPTTEMLAQALLAVAVLAAAISLETRWRPPAALAGLLLSLGFLARPDGVLLVLGGAAAVTAIVALAGWDGRLGWFLGGLALPLPHAALQAWDWNRNYSDANDLPTPGLVAVLLVALAAGCLIWRRVIHTRAVGLADRLRAGQQHARGLAPAQLQRTAGILLAVGAFLFLAFCALRPRLLGQDFLDYNRQVIRSYDEVNLKRLGWFITLPGLLLMWLGVVVLGLRRWRAVQWLVVLPGAALLPVYLWAARISPRQMWWGRRYVPSVTMGIVILMAVALAFAFAYRGRWWPAASGTAAVVLVAIVGIYLSQSVPLMDHREMAGSYSAVEDIVANAGDQRGVFLWTSTEGGANAGRDLGAAVWFTHDQISALLPEEDQAAAVDAYQAAFPDSPVFVVTSNGDPPPPELAGRVEQVDRVERQLPFWEESTEERPDEPGVPYGVDATVWLVAPAA